MPTYEYVCSKCDHHFDLVQSMKDASLEICPKDLCKLKRWGKGKVRRAIGAGGGLIFKGEGFYITDYRSDKYKAAAKKEAPEAPKKAESKPAASSPPAAPKPR